MHFKAYNELAWVDEILAAPESYKEEADHYIRQVKNHVAGSSLMMLHLGCGAGGHDFHFKKHFSVTGVDISKGMLDIARKVNPENRYINADMRHCMLDEAFDVVIIPDSIMYMNNFNDLQATIKNAKQHLKSSGVLLVVAQIKEEYQDNNFVYVGEKGPLQVTLFENNTKVNDSTYEATMIYLIRDKGKQSIHHEVHTLGLFSHDQWMTIFDRCQLKVEERNLDHLYDQFVLDEGEYKLKVFIANHSI